VINFYALQAIIDDCNNILQLTLPFVKQCPARGRRNRCDCESLQPHILAYYYYSDYFKSSI